MSDSSQPQDMDGREVVRFSGSPVYHYYVGFETACGERLDESKPGNGNRSDERDYQTAPESSASEFFRKCSNCESSFVADYQMTIPEMKREIALSLGVDLGKTATFGREAVMALYKRHFNEESQEDGR